MDSMSTKTESILKPSITLKGHDQMIASMSYFPDGQRIISRSWDQTVRQWNLKAGKEIVKARGVYKAEVPAVAVSRDGRWIVTGGGSELTACEVGTGVVKRFGGYESRIKCVDISEDNTLMAGGSADGTTRIWNLDTGKLVAGPFRNASWVDTIRISTDCKKLAVRSGSCLEIWDVRSQTLDVTLKREDYTSTPIFWTNNNKNILTAFSSTRTIYEFDASTLKTVGTPFEGHTRSVTSLALSFDHTLLASAGYKDTIKLWAFESRQLLTSFDVQNPCFLVLSPDSRQLAYTTYTESEIYICDIPTEVLAQTCIIARLRGPTEDPESTTILPAIAFPHPSQTPSSTVASRLPDPREFLPSSSHSRTGFTAHNIEPDDLKAMLHDLSKYIVKDGEYPVARGGFGEIWKCILNKDRSSIKVAVKALYVYTDDQLGPAKTKKIKRIMHELRICSKLNHPNILRICGYAYGFGPLPAIVSLWAENGNLTTYLEREGPALTLVRRFKLLRDIIAGLQYLHANYVIHGDFNGPSVLIHGDGTACIADFGLSFMYSEFISASQASYTSTLKGNVRWMAPELIVEREDGSQVRPSEQSDMYSFGGVMLQVLTDKVPYYHLVNDARIIFCIAKSETPSRSRYPELPEQYWQLIEQCWSTDPEDRPSTEGADTTIRNEFYSLSRPR